MTIAISELRIDYAPYREPFPETRSLLGSYGEGISGSVRVGRREVVIDEPHWSSRNHDTITRLSVDPADLDALIAALQQARDLGRQMFNRAEDGEA